MRSIGRSAFEAAGKRDVGGHIGKAREMLQICGLKKQYGTFAVDCDLEVLPGRITGMIGENGAGKSTTFKAVLGLIRPDGGKITLLKKDVCQFTAEDRQRLGVELAEAGISGYLTVRDLERISAQIYPKFDREKFEELCGRFQIPQNQQIKEFSTGMKAKLKVIAAVTHDADFLILDEPTAGLDVVARDEVLTLLREFMEEKEERGILISSHISSDLEGLCDDFYMIHEGKIILHEDTDRLLSDYGILKLDEAQYKALDKTYLLRRKKESYGWLCLTDERRFYQENYPGIVVEKGSLDELILMMVKGEKA